MSKVASVWVFKRYMSRGKKRVKRGKEKENWDFGSCDLTLPHFTLIDF